MSIHSFTWNVGDDDEEVTVNVLQYAPEIPGKYHGPWEDSYPTEPAEVDYEVIRADGSEYTALTTSEEVNIHDMIVEAMENYDDY
jgi:hypothetical protein